MVFPHFTDREAEAPWGCGACSGHTATVRQVRSRMEILANGGKNSLLVSQPSQPSKLPAWLLVLSQSELSSFFLNIQP